MQNPSRKLLDINSWNDFFSYANTLTEKGKGDIFEYLTKLILTTRPEYTLMLKNVWIQQEGIPKEIREKVNLPTSDEGIDIVAETFTGEFWAIQCKFKGQNQTPTYKELSTFGNLANNYCKNISLALLVHTGEKGVRKRILLGENYSEIGLDFWLGLTHEDWGRIHKQLKGQSVRPTPKIPRPHQEIAIKSATRHFTKNKARRGRLIMPCATGKSLTAFWIAHALDAKSVIVAVPSLALIKQSLEDWTREFVAHKEEPRPEWLVICSDESTANLDNSDKFVSDAHSMGIPTTTNIEVISAFLNENHIGRKVIFTTYQSSDKLAQAARNCKFSFDLAILDEAHKTVGVKSKTFATLLSDKNISISKRMFMTATERVMRGSNDEVYSMDDEAIYGGLFHQLTFKEAIHAEPPIICDYKVLTITVTNDEIKQLIAKNKLLTDKGEKLEEQEAQSLASAIALRKATQKYGIKHAISFHRSIKSADDFAKLNSTLNSGSLDEILLSSSHISSKKSAGERARLLNDFAHEQLALMTNARCLTEGVDVPAIDCVLFADPKQSIVDIVQASGRALRPYPGKECGYIMLPLIVPDGKTLEEFTESTPFKEVARIIAALSTQDEGIAEEFRITNNGKQNGGKRIVFEGTVPVGMKLDLNNFADKINAKIWERVAKVNWRPFEEARAFVQELQLKSSEDWHKFCLSGFKPNDIPSNPDKNYKDKGYKGMGDWLGTGRIADQYKEFRSFDEAKVFVQSLKLNNNSEWRRYCLEGNRPVDIPTNPHTVYLNKGWISYGDWFGTNAIASSKIVYRPFNEARAFVQKLKLKNGKEWKTYCKNGNKPDDIPSVPAQTYFNNGWKGMGDWLGTYTIAKWKKVFLPFCDARAFVHELKLKNREEWTEYCKSGNKPDNIPASPNATYAGNGWQGIGDWLGTGTIAPFLREYLPFEEAREYVHKLNLKNQKQWFEYSRTDQKPKNIPGNPYSAYKSKGWKGLGDWLGTGSISTYFIEYKPFFDAKAFVHNLNLKSQNNWIRYCQSGLKPNDIPAKPDRTYADKGWIGYGDWLGIETIATRKRIYRSFLEARLFVHLLNLKTQGDWKNYCQSGIKPADIPAKPDNTYSGKGWCGMGDWLGTGNIAARLKVYRQFEDARTFVHKLKLRNNKQWLEYAKSGQKPADIPANPSKTYANKGWKGMSDWLGNGIIPVRFKEYLDFKDAKSFVHHLKLAGVSAWRKYCKSGEKPDFIPSNPDNIYKSSGWIGYGDWLGTGTVAPFLREYMPFDEAKEFVHKLNISSTKEWKNYCKTGEKPANIPANPYGTYSKKGWISWIDWLGIEEK
jgi:superfamily II DNA or RNA helicase